MIRLKKEKIIITGIMYKLENNGNFDEYFNQSPELIAQIILDISLSRINT